jgi:hypothetical protein
VQSFSQCNASRVGERSEIGAEHDVIDIGRHKKRKVAPLAGLDANIERRAVGRQFGEKQRTIDRIRLPIAIALTRNVVHRTDNATTVTGAVIRTRVQHERLDDERDGAERRTRLYAEVVRACRRLGQRQLVAIAQRCHGIVCQLHNTGLARVDVSAMLRFTCDGRCAKRANASPSDGVGVGNGVGTTVASYDVSQSIILYRNTR